MFAASVNLGVTHRQRVHVGDSVQFGSQIYSMPQAMQILVAKAAADKERKKLETIPAWL